MSVRKILLVEDSPDDVALTRRALNKSGCAHELMVLSNGQEALDYLLPEGEYSRLEPDDRPDLIFLDLNMPLLGGLDVLMELKARKPTRLIPIVILTSSKEEEDIARSYKLGANSYVWKRVDTVAFEAALKDILTYWFECIQLPPKRKAFSVD